jgi:uncharacterized protein YdcH (DUF465 family)
LRKNLYGPLFEIIYVFSFIFRLAFEYYLKIKLVCMNKKITENLNKEIQSLMNKDFDLRKSIERSEKDLIVDNIEIEQLKKEKLKIKDKILAKQNELKSALDKTSIEL